MISLRKVATKPLYNKNSIAAKNKVFAIKSIQKRIVNFRLASGNDLSSSFSKYRRVPMIQCLVYCW